jgi:hypothetical protein
MNWLFDALKGWKVEWITEQLEMEGKMVWLGDRLVEERCNELARRKR